MKPLYQSNQQSHPCTKPRRNTMTALVILKAWAIILLFTPKVVLTLESDQRAPIEIQADQAELNETDQTARYLGNVELQQGTLRIVCDELLIVNTDAGISKVHATGSPAQYEQTLDENQPPLQAQALEIIYIPQDGKIVLKEQASIKQSGHVFEGYRIEYDINKQLLSASSSQNDKGSHNSNPTKNRVKMTLQPKVSP